MSLPAIAIAALLLGGCGNSEATSDPQVTRVDASFIFDSNDPADVIDNADSVFIGTVVGAEDPVVVAGTNELQTATDEADLVQTYEEAIEEASS